VGQKSGRCGAARRERPRQAGGRDDPTSRKEENSEWCADKDAGAPTTCRPRALSEHSSRRCLGVRLGYARVYSSHALLFLINYPPRALASPPDSSETFPDKLTLRFFLRFFETYRLSRSNGVQLSKNRLTCSEAARKLNIRNSEYSLYISARRGEEILKRKILRE